MADPFEEFEFKPLTEGLGFHKKNKTDFQVKTQSQWPSSVRFNSTSMDLLDSSVENDSPLQPPLPRNTRTQIKTPASDDSAAAVEEILQTLRSKKMETPKTNVTTRTAPTLKYKKGLQNFSAFVLDAMLVLAATLLCMIVVLSITKVDVTRALLSSESTAWMYLSTLALFGLVSFVYLVGHRIFLGATPGEWAYDQRIGHPTELGTAGYAISVIARSALVVLTGIFILPLVSKLMKRDLVGDLSQTQILERA